MELYMNLINWLNTEEEEARTVLRRDGVYAMLSWRDFNPEPEASFNFRTAAWLFILAVGLPVVVLTSM